MQLHLNADERYQSMSMRLRSLLTMQPAYQLGYSSNAIAAKVSDMVYTARSSQVGPHQWA